MPTGVAVSTRRRDDDDDDDAIRRRDTTTTMATTMTTAMTTTAMGARSLGGGGGRLRRGRAMTTTNKMRTPATRRDGGRARAAARDGAAAHDGIVDAGLVHESSLASCGFAPDRRGATTNGKTTTAKETARMWTSATCPFAHRPWLALVESGAPFELNVENLENKSEGFKATFARASPDASGNPSVPILEHAGATMVESALVLKYVSETFGNDALIPKDPLKGYYGQIFADTFQACVPLYFKMLRATNAEELAEAESAFVAGLKKANRCLELGTNAREDGPYACGAQFTTCDIMAMTFVPRFEIVLDHYRGFNLRVTLKENDCAALESWIAAVSTRPSMVYTLGEIEKMTGKSLTDAFIAHFAKFVSWNPKAATAA